MITKVYQSSLMFFVSRSTVKDSFRRQSAVKWAQQRGFQASMPRADSTGPGPTESSAGRAVLSQFPAD
eukprot:7820863-Pyramimonas_sp.AAC.1